MASPVITVDGPSGCGKGTLSQQLAHHFGFRLLDSGALYRLIALKVMEKGIDATNQTQVLALLDALEINFRPTDKGTLVEVDGVDVSEAIRHNDVAQVASKISKFQELRLKLLDIQRRFSQGPGLVADGRDMGTVVFPEAPFKIFLEASIEERAKRRYKQLSCKGFCVSLAEIECQLNSRDLADRTRAHSPLYPAADAWVLDTTESSINQVFDQALLFLRERGLAS